MTADQLRELFKATNTAEPLSEGWPGLLRFGMAVAAAEREECARVCHLYAVDNRIHSLATRGAHDCEKAIRARSNVLADRREPIGEASSPKGDGRAAG